MYERTDVCKVEKDQSDTVSKAANPGKFKDKRNWLEWEPAFIHYLSTIHGVDGIPLCYVIRDLETPEQTFSASWIKFKLCLTYLRRKERQSKSKPK